MSRSAVVVDWSMLSILRSAVLGFALVFADHPEYIKGDRFSSEFVDRRRLE